MKRILLGFILGVVVLFGFKFWSDTKDAKSEVDEQSLLIEQQIKNVSKIIVTESYFSEVFTFKNSKTLFGNYIQVDKNALVIVNAEVTIAFDLSKIEFDLDRRKKVLTIVNIPEEEIKINPDIEFYDIQSDYLNPFKAKDYNNINNKIKLSLQKKIEKSNLKLNAKERLINELGKFYILTNSFGWTLKYKEKQIENWPMLSDLYFSD